MRIWLYGCVNVHDWMCTMCAYDVRTMCAYDVWVFVRCVCRTLLFKAKLVLRTTDPEIQVDAASVDMLYIQVHPPIHPPTTYHLPPTTPHHSRTRACTRVSGCTCWLFGANTRPCDVDVVCIEC